MVLPVVGEEEEVVGRSRNEQLATEVDWLVGCLRVVDWLERYTGRPEVSFFSSAGH